MKNKKRFSFGSSIIFFAILGGLCAGCAQKEPEYMRGGWWGTVASNEVTKDGDRMIKIQLSDIDTDGKCFILKPDTYVDSHISVEEILSGDYIYMDVLAGAQTEEGIVCIELIIHPPFAPIQQL